MTTFLTVIHILTCLFMVLFVLIQSGKGAEISASFGGSSQTVFGSSGGANFFQKVTYGLAAVFMLTSISLTLLGSRSRQSVFDQAPTSTPQSSTAPATPPAPSAPAQTPAQ